MTGRDELLRPADLEREKGIDQSTLATWRARGIGPEWEYRGPRRVVYRRSSVDAWEAAEADRSRAVAS